MSILVTILMVFFSVSSYAHDIGVSPARLEPLDDGSYRLSVQAGFGLSALFPPPELPQHCRLTGNPTGEQDSFRKSFFFECDGGLGAEDRLRLPWRRDGVLFTVHWREGVEVTRLFDRKGGWIEVPLAELKAGSGGWKDAAQRYFMLGVEHILLGVDHLLFVLALLFIVEGTRKLVKTITAFTLAHSLTLALATLGVLQVSSAPVEASIALSIMFLAREILQARNGSPGLTHRSPWTVAFVFGLLHGLGFAGALAEIGLPHDEIPAALLFFNLGVEAGQLMFVLVVMSLLWMARRLFIVERQVAEAFVVYGIGVIASYWFIERLSAIFQPV